MLELFPLLKNTWKSQISGVEEEANFGFWGLMYSQLAPLGLWGDRLLWWEVEWETGTEWKWTPVRYLLTSIKVHPLPLNIWQLHNGETGWWPNLYYMRLWEHYSFNYNTTSFAREELGISKHKECVPAFPQLANVLLLSSHSVHRLKYTMCHIPSEF